MAFNVLWSEHLTNSELYGNLPKFSEKIRLRSETLRETYRRDSIRLDFMATITRKTEQSDKTNEICGQSPERYNMRRVEELQSLMIDRDTWTNVVKNSVWLPA